MDLPEFNFPMNLCQHGKKEGERRRIFAEYGSYSQLACSSQMNRATFFRKAACIPQKGMGTIDGLSENLLPIPLFEKPIDESACTKIYDYLLGVCSFNEAMEAVDAILQQVKYHACTSNLATKDSYLKKILAFEKAVESCIKEPDNPEHREQLQRDVMPEGLHATQKACSKVSTVFNDDWVFGYNRDFYQGLLCHTESPTSTFLFHATGQTFDHIYMSEVSSDSDHIQIGRHVSSVNMNDPVFQLTCSDKGLLCARQKTRCCVLTYEHEDNEKLCNSNRSISLDVDNSELSDVTVSPFTNEEIILSSKKGEVYLCNINSSHQTAICSRVNSNTERFWSSCMFAGHPRQVIVSNWSSMDLYDHRDKFQKGRPLFSLSASFVKKSERIMATTTFGFPYHLVATDFSLFLVDQRFAGSPVLQWCSESITVPQLLKTCKLSNVSYRSNESDQLLFVGSQQPAEVVCYPFHLAQGCPPVTKTLPWSAGKISDFSNKYLMSYTNQWLDIDKHFHSSLAGLTVVSESRSNQDNVTVYQMDGYGDIYFQKFAMKPDFRDPGNYICVRPSEATKSAASHRAMNFLSSLDKIQNKDSILTVSSSQTDEPENSEFEKVTQYFKSSLETEKATEVKKKDTMPSLSFEDFQRVLSYPGSSMKSWNKLRKTGWNTQLLLALKENHDISQILVEREKDHQAKVTRLHEKKIKAETPRRKKSRKEQMAKLKKEYLEYLAQQNPDDSVNIAEARFQDTDSDNFIPSKTELDDDSFCYAKVELDDSFNDSLTGDSSSNLSLVEEYSSNVSLTEDSFNTTLTEKEVEEDSSLMIIKQEDDDTNPVKQEDVVNDSSTDTSQSETDEEL